MLAAAGHDDVGPHLVQRVIANLRAAAGSRETRATLEAGRLTRDVEEQDVAEPVRGAPRRAHSPLRPPGGEGRNVNGGDGRESEGRVGRRSQGAGTRPREGDRRRRTRGQTPARRGRRGAQGRRARRARGALRAQGAGRRRGRRRPPIAPPPTAPRHALAQAEAALAQARSCRARWAGLSGSRRDPVAGRARPGILREHTATGCGLPVALGLQREQVRVAAAGGDQLVVRALLDDRAASRARGCDRPCARSGSGAR